MRQKRWKDFPILHVHSCCSDTRIWHSSVVVKWELFPTVEIVSFYRKHREIFVSFSSHQKKAKAKILLNSNFFSPISKIFRGKAISSYTHTYIQEFYLLLCFFHSPFPYSVYIHSLRSLARIHIAGRISLWNKLP